MANKEPLLDLSTFTTREHILIDGSLFELKNKDELSLLDYESFNHTGAKINEFAHKKSKFTIVDATELKRLTSIALKRIFVTRVPNEIMDKLTLEQRTQIIGVFTDLLSVKTSTGEAGAEQNNKEKRIGV